MLRLGVAHRDLSLENILLTGHLAPVGREDIVIITKFKIVIVVIMVTRVLIIMMVIIVGIMIATFIRLTYLYNVFVSPSPDSGPSSDAPNTVKLIDFGMATCPKILIIIISVITSILLLIYFVGIICFAVPLPLCKSCSHSLYEGSLLFVFCGLLVSIFAYSFLLLVSGFSFSTSCSALRSGFLLLAFCFCFAIWFLLSTSGFLFFAFCLSRRLPVRGSFHIPECSELVIRGKAQNGLFGGLSDRL